ncbi:mannitol-1-phosphate 5-dehydrogenase [Marinilactibacillus psychrotolerans]|uniref:Mannitol-1-phosphate 5-dehydrogenase n=1 Tax=Marinilactibacillus psychrotolerans TaxID=191770 RepID=A0ABW8UJ29_9LACT
MLTVHFGAGNIGRGFIGEVLNQNHSKIAFVDVNEQVINALNKENKYTIEEASDEGTLIEVDNVYGINNAKNPTEVIEAIAEAELITTAIGPNILPLIAPLIAQGIQKRKELQNETPIDIIACENMIGGSSFFKQEVMSHIKDETVAEYLEQYVGFPDAAVDRIVPQQTHEDPLKVTVEPYKEWVISLQGMKNTELKLKQVHYVEDLAPFIERKLFTVNTGHATVAYNGAFAGYQTIDESLKDDKVLKEVKSVLQETGALLIDKWGFDEKTHTAYIEKILSRFQNPKLSDDVTRVGRTPIRKLGYDERFIRPIREAYERGLSVNALIATVAKALRYNDLNDSESVELQNMLNEKSVSYVVQEVTQLNNKDIQKRIVDKYEEISK